MIDEGYIKFNIHWDKESLNIENFPLDILQWRDKMYDLGLIGHDTTHNVGYGNISIRYNNKILISGTQTGEIKKILPEHFSLVTSYNIDENDLSCKGLIKASSESMTHAVIYEEDTEIQAVIHIHNKALWKRYMNIIPTTREDVPYGTPEMAYEMRRLFKETDVLSSKTIIMAGHEDGIISFGNSLEEAGQKIISLISSLDTVQ